MSVADGPLPISLGVGVPMRARGANVVTKAFVGSMAIPLNLAGAGGGAPRKRGAGGQAAAETAQLGIPLTLGSLSGMTPMRHPVLAA